MGRSEGRLEAFGSLLGRSWETLGASWTALAWVLGPLGRLLGVSWADLKAFKTTCKMLSDFKSELGTTVLICLGLWEAKIDQNGT